MEFFQFTQRTFMLGFTLITLSGCFSDGGSSSSGNDDMAGIPDQGSETAVDTANVTGTAARGAPLVNAKIEANCNNDSGFLDDVTSDENGEFSGEVDVEDLPCKLRAIAEDKSLTLHSLVNERDERSNITPFTDMVTQIAAKKPVKDWFKESRFDISKDALSKSWKTINQTLKAKGYRVGENDNPFNKSFEIGDTYDQQMDRYFAGIEQSANIENHNNIMDMIADGNIGNEHKTIPSPPKESDANPDPKDLTKPSQQMLDNFPGDYYESVAVWNDFLSRNIDKIQDTTSYIHFPEKDSDNAILINDKTAFAWPVMDKFHIAGDYSLPVEIEDFPDEPFPGYITRNAIQNSGDIGVSIRVWVKGVDSIGGLKYARAESFNVEGEISEMWDMTHFHVDDLDLNNSAISNIRPLQNFTGSRLTVGGSEVSDISPISGKKFEYLSLHTLDLESIEPLKTITVTEELKLDEMEYPRGENSRYPEGLPASAPICSNSDLKISDGHRGVGNDTGRDFICQ